MVGLTVTAYLLNQKGYTLYLFPLSSVTLRKLCFVTPRSEGDPNEVQRILKEKRAKDIGEYIKKENSLLPNAIVVNLSNAVKILPTGENNKVTLQFPVEEGKYAYILDGQHRLAGFNYSDGIEFDLPVVALHNANIDIRGKIFADINSKQEKVSDEHILSLYYQIRDLPKDEAATVDVVMKLYNEGPLAGKVKIREDQKNYWVKNVHLKKLIAPFCESGGYLANKTSSEQAKIFNEYLNAASLVWTEAWGNKEYLLTAPFGIEILFGIFPAVLHRVDLNEGKKYTKESFVNQMMIIQDVAISLPGGGSVTLDWIKGGQLRVFAHRQGRNMIIKQLKDMLRKADES